MYHHLATDAASLRSLLEKTLDEAYRHLSTLDAKPAAILRPNSPMPILPAEGLGALATLTHFADEFAASMTASSGARFWGFVTGGTTPAALLGDWLASSYDINLADRNHSGAPLIELGAIHLLRQLFHLPDAFRGIFVSGATLSNLVGLATAREWVSQQHGQHASQDGLYGLPPIPILSAAPHSSISKALAMLGMGRGHIQRIPTLAGNREAVNLAALEQALMAFDGKPCIVVGNAGTVNTTDFDDLNGIADLQARYPFWLHVDAAFGGFAACSPHYRHLVAGMERADSLTIDAHKWLNVPYDSAMIFTRHQALQAAVFQNIAAYLTDVGDEPDFFHLAPENSRRFRALPAWFTLLAYGRNGYQDIVERNAAMAAQLGALIEASGHFRLLAPVRLNIVCFTLAEEASAARVQQFLQGLRDDGRVFLTGTTYQGVAGIRAAFSNWRTEADDLAVAWEAMEGVVKGLT